MKKTARGEDGRAPRQDLEGAPAGMAAPELRYIELRSLGMRKERLVHHDPGRWGGRHRWLFRGTAGAGRPGCHLPGPPASWRATARARAADRGAGGWSRRR